MEFKVSPIHRSSFRIMISFSFIIPHYNLNPSLFKKCLDSIPRRDDIEIIIVDDHTPCLYDANGELDEKKKVLFPGLGENNIDILFLPQNTGPGVARNIGLEKARGEWIFFADADDYYDTDSLQHLMTQCLNTKYDAIWFGYGDRTIYGYDCVDKDAISDCSKLIKEEIIKVVAPWNKVVRKSLLVSRNISFSDGYYCEDQFYSVRSICECSCPGVYFQNVYCHLSNEGSLSKTDSLDKLKKGHAIEMAYNRYLRQRQLLSNSCRNILLGGLLYRIWLQKPWLYRWYVIKEFLYFGWQITKEDYKKTCILRNIRPNLLYQLTDPIRVKLGAVLRQE